MHNYKKHAWLPHTHVQLRINQQWVLPLPAFNGQQWRCLLSVRSAMTANNEGQIGYDCK